MMLVRMIGLVTTVSLAACQRDEPAVIAASLIPELEQLIDAQHVEPHYLVPADSLTAAVLQPLGQRRRITVGPAPSAVICPWSGSAGIYGYHARIVLDSVRRRTAIGAWRLTCTGPDLRGGFAAGAKAQLQRGPSGWHVKKWLDRYIT